MSYRRYLVCRWRVSSLAGTLVVGIVCLSLVATACGDTSPSRTPDDSQSSGFATDRAAQSTTADATTPTRPPASTSTPTTHTVQAGETLRVIAQRYGVTVQAIVDANDIENPDVIHVGDQFVIPDASAAPNPTDASAEGQTVPSPTRPPPTATPAPGRTPAPLGS